MRASWRYFFKVCYLEEEGMFSASRSFKPITFTCAGLNSQLYRSSKRRQTYRNSAIKTFKWKTFEPKSESATQSHLFSSLKRHKWHDLLQPPLHQKRHLHMKYTEQRDLLFFNRTEMEVERRGEKFNPCGEWNALILQSKRQLNIRKYSWPQWTIFSTKSFSALPQIFHHTKNVSYDVFKKAIL